MARRRIALLPGAALALSLLLSGLFAGSVAAGGGCHAGLERDAAATTINLVGNCFDPLIARVPVGGSVTFVNNDTEVHSVTGAANNWGTYEPFGKGETAIYRFSQAGVFPYFCIIHPGMVGVVLVGDGAPGASGTSVDLISMGAPAVAATKASAVAATKAPAATAEPQPTPAATPAPTSAAAVAPARPADGGGSTEASNAASPSPTAPTGLLIIGVLGVLLAAGAAYGFGLFPRRRPSPR